MRRTVMNWGGKSVWIAAGLLLAAAAASGCQSGAVADDPPDPPIVDARGAATVAKLVTGTPTRMVYDEKGGKQTTVQRGEEVGVKDGAWWTKYLSGTDSKKPEREVHLVTDAQGNVGASEEINRGEKVEITYDPPLVVIPKSLEAGGSYTEKLKMTVYPLGDRSKPRMAGTATNEIHYVGDGEVKVDGKTVRARKLEAKLTAQLQNARTINTSEQWWADGIGLVRQRDREVTTMLGLKVRDNTSLMALSKYSK